jgi:hypothetical protein
MSASSSAKVLECTCVRIQGYAWLAWGLWVQFVMTYKYATARNWGGPGCCAGCSNSSSNRRFMRDVHNARQ